MATQARYTSGSGIYSLLCSLLFLCTTFAQAASITAPSPVGADSEITITLEGVNHPRDFVTIVAKGAPEGAYEEYQYTKGNQVKLFAPLEAGDYEIRWLGAESPYPTRVSKPLQVIPVTASVKVAETAAIGSAVAIEWQGPNNPLDFITLVPEGAAERSYEDYVYTKKGKKVSLTAPTTPGRYEVRYLTGRGYKTLAKAALTITDTSASVSFKSPATIGQSLEIAWSGPANAREYITVVEAGAAEGKYGDYTYLTAGNPLRLTVPEKPGDYEIRYMTADSTRTLARAPLKIVAATASLQAPATAVARQPVKVQWTGPDNAQDYVAITQPGKPKAYINYAYTRRGNPVDVEAPEQPGEYEIHYLTGRTDQSLASLKISITPSATPGFLQVTHSGTTPGGSMYRTVEVVLDASGSMLQKLDGKRRIDIAKTTLNQLLDTLPAKQTRFALRVFGHRKADSCDTELLIPPSSANAASLKQTVSGLEAKNLARTPIADSLAKVKQDLAGAEGNALVILLTDGEETCNGDPEAAIRALRASGLQVQVSIVGFAIGEYALKQTFARWAQAGGGAYFDAKNAEMLSKALQDSLQTPFTVLDVSGNAVASAVVGGLPLELPAGEYRVRIGTNESPITIKPGETTQVSP